MNSDTTEKPDLVVSKRPLILAILSLASIAAFSLIVLLVLLAFIHPIDPDVLKKYPSGYFIGAAILVPIGFAGSVGLWMMRRWGLYFYVAFVVLGFVWNFVDNGDSGLSALLVFLVVIGTGMAFFK